jgi:PPOX class probable F420-dependent enzyme
MPGLIDLLSDRAVSDLISAAPIAHLATVSAAGEPHNIPLCFWFDGARFYFVIDEKPKRKTGIAIKRMKNIAENPRVALLIDHYDDDWTHLAYVLVNGAAKVVDDAGEYSRAIENLRDKYPQYRIMQLSAERNPLVRIDPNRVHAWGARFTRDESR